jgi:hypothetical protein
MWYGAGVCGFVGGERVPSSALRSRLGGGAHTPLFRMTRCALLARRSLGLGGVSVNAAEATKGIRPSAFLDSTQNGQRPRALRRAVLATARTRRGPSSTTPGGARTPTSHPLKTRDPTATPRVRCPVKAETRDSTHDTSTSTTEVTTVPSDRHPGLHPPVFTRLSPGYVFSITPV